MNLNSNLLLRASCNINQLEWQDSPSNGVQRRRLECFESKTEVERVTTIVRFAPQSSFAGHVHGGGEEFLVLEGVFSDQHGDYPAGYYIRNPKGTGHAPYSKEGCTILVKLWQMHADDTLQLATNTRDKSLWQKNTNKGEILPLFNADYESVSMLNWKAGSQMLEQEFNGGVEYFVLKGRFSDDEATYTEGSWLRLPAKSTQNIIVNEPCLVLRKTGHLLNPVSYE